MYYNTQSMILQSSLYHWCCNYVCKSISSNKVYFFFYFIRVGGKYRIPLTFAARCACLQSGLSKLVPCPSPTWNIQLFRIYTPVLMHNHQCGGMFFSCAFLCVKVFLLVALNLISMRTNSIPPLLPSVYFFWIVLWKTYKLLEKNCTWNMISDQCWYVKKATPFLSLCIVRYLCC